MIQDSLRITLISRDPKRTDREWNQSREAASRAILLDSVTVLRHAIGLYLQSNGLVTTPAAVDEPSSNAVLRQQHPHLRAVI